MKSRQLKLWKGPLPTWKKQRSPCKSKINFCFHVNFEVCLNFGSYSSPNTISHSTDFHNTNFQDCPKYFARCRVLCNKFFSVMQSFWKFFEDHLDLHSTIFVLVFLLLQKNVLDEARDDCSQNF